MELLCVGLVLLLMSSADSQLKIRGRVVHDSEVDWKRLNVPLKKELVFAPRSADPNGTLPESERVPTFIIVSSANDPVEDFKPELGARDLPDRAREVLLQAMVTTAAPPPGGGTTGVEVACQIDRLYVRVKKDIFKVRMAFQNLKLGTCAVNKILDDHYYFLYPLTANCGFKILSNVDDFILKTSLRYGPVGPVIRDTPFNIEIKCKYPRFFHSFKVGAHPKVGGGTVHKLLKQCVYSLKARDEYGNELTSNTTVTVGTMLYFEAEQASGPGMGRMYILKCFLTTSKNPNSEPKFYVIDKGGCMMDSAESERSKFLPGDSKSVLKFSMAAIALNDSLSLSSPVQQKLFMHCETAMGPETATEAQKACNYDMQEKKWKELYDDDSVCVCCDSTCVTKQSKSSKSNIITSRAWKVNWSNNEELDIDFSLENQS